MGRLDDGEKEFISDFGGLEPVPSTRQPLARTAPAAVQPPVAPPAPKAQAVAGNSLQPRRLDLKHVPRPLSLLHAFRALAQAAPGEVLAFATADEGTLGEFQSLARYTGHDLLEQRETGVNQYEHVLQRRR